MNFTGKGKGFEANGFVPECRGLAALPLLFLLFGPVQAGVPKYAVVDGAQAVPLALHNAYFRKPGNPAVDYWALAPFYAPQQTGASCSAASVALALNALLNARRPRGDEDENISEEAVTGKVTGFDWKALVSEAADGGRRGLKLEQLAQAAGEALGAYGALKSSVSAVEVRSCSPELLANFRRDLAANELDPRDIILLHFAQDALTGAPGGPFAHISPVGAYDSKTLRVLVMDVDRRWYEPYWVSDEQLLKAMSVKTESFGFGGYVRIKISK